MRTFQVFCAALSVVVTAAIYQLDRSASRSARAQWHLAQSRQIAAQVDSLVLASPRQGTGSDPLAWAITLLNSGPTGKVVRLVKQRRDAAALNAERGVLSSDGLTFNYERMIRPSEGLALEIETTLSFHGFLGTTSRVFADFALALVGACLFLLFYALIGKRWGVFHWDPAREVVALRVPSAQQSLHTAAAQHAELTQLLVAIQARGQVSASEAQKILNLAQSISSAHVHAARVLDETLRKAA